MEIKTPGFIVYAGRREKSSGGFLFKFYAFTDAKVNTKDIDEETLKVWTFETSLFKNPIVGTVYPCTFIR